MFSFLCALSLTHKWRSVRLQPHRSHWQQLHFWPFFLPPKSETEDFLRLRGSHWKHQGCTNKSVSMQQVNSQWGALTNIKSVLSTCQGWVPLQMLIGWNQSVVTNDQSVVSANKVLWTTKRQQVNSWTLLYICFKRLNKIRFTRTDLLCQSLNKKWCTAKLRKHSCQRPELLTSLQTLSGWGISSTGQDTAAVNGNVRTRPGRADSPQPSLSLVKLNKY